MKGPRKGVRAEEERGAHQAKPAWKGVQRGSLAYTPLPLRYLHTSCPWEAWISLQSQKSGSSSSQHSPAPRKPARQCQGTQMLLPVWTGWSQPRMADRVLSQTLRGCSAQLGPMSAPSLLGHQAATSLGGLPHAAPPFPAHPNLVRVFTLLPAL